MAWERRYGGLYYYRSYRDADGRVRKQYFGNGPAAFAAAEQDVARRAEHASARQAERQRREADLALCEEIAAISANADALVAAALLAAGYHRPQRKPWRKQRSRRIEPC
jgi:hypothetical protein